MSWCVVPGLLAMTKCSFCMSQNSQQGALKWLAGQVWVLLKRVENLENRSSKVPIALDSRSQCKVAGRRSFGQIAPVFSEYIAPQPAACYATSLPHTVRRTSSCHGTQISRFCWVCRTSSCGGVIACCSSSCRGICFSRSCRVRRTSLCGEIHRCRDSGKPCSNQCPECLPVSVPVVEHISPAPAVCAAPVMVVEYITPAPVASYGVPVPISPAPAVYAATCSCVCEIRCSCRTGSCRGTHLSRSHGVCRKSSCGGSSSLQCQWEIYSAGACSACCTSSCRGKLFSRSFGECRTRPCRGVHRSSSCRGKHFSRSCGVCRTRTPVGKHIALAPAACDAALAPAVFAAPAPVGECIFSSASCSACRTCFYCGVFRTIYSWTCRACTCCGAHLTSTSSCTCG